MSKQYMTPASARAALNVLTATGGTLNGCKCHLMKAWGNGTRIPPGATPIEADFPGYAASAALTWGTAFNTQTAVAVEANRVQFTSTGDTTEQGIGGYYLATAATPPVVLLVVPFDVDKGVKEVADAISLVPAYHLPVNLDPVPA